MGIRRGEVWWTDLDTPRGSETGYRRPVLIVQDDRLNASNLNTIIVVAFTSNLSRVSLGTQVLLRASETGLPSDSAAVATQIFLLDRSDFTERVSQLSSSNMGKVEFAMMTALGIAG